MRVEALIRRTPVTISPSATIRQAAEVFAREKIGLLVVATSVSPVKAKAVISERDVVRAVNRLGAAALDQTVSSIMSAEVLTCAPSDTLESLMVTMTEHRVRHIPVVADGVLAGIVSIGDVVKNRIDELEDDRKALVDYINAR